MFGWWLCDLDDIILVCRSGLWCLWRFLVMIFGYFVGMFGMCWFGCCGVLDFDVLICCGLFEFGVVL